MSAHVCAKCGGDTRTVAVFAGFWRKECAVCGSTGPFAPRFTARAATQENVTEQCPGCGGDAADNWFDRTVCPPPCASMHTRCRECGRALDNCAWETAEGMSVLGCCPHGVDLDRAFCPDGCRV